MRCKNIWAYHVGEEATAERIVHALYYEMDKDWFYR